MFDILGLSLIGIAWILRPRVIEKSKTKALDPAAYPKLYEFLNQIAQKLGTHIDQIIIDEAYNASFTQVGWRRINTITIGLPLWEALTKEERTALIAHEIGHAVNGDFGRTFVVATAINSLFEWHKLLQPVKIFNYREGLAGLIKIPLNLIGAGVAKIVWGIILVMIYLLYDEKQRAEYLADRLAATLAGSEASMHLLQKLLFANSLDLVIQHFALKEVQTITIFDSFNERILSAPSSEKLRLLRLEDYTQIRLDRTHPSTSLRIKMLKQSPIQVPSLMVDQSLMPGINRELTGLKPIIQARLVDQYRDSLYYR